MSRNRTTLAVLIVLTLWLPGVAGAGDLEDERARVRNQAEELRSTLDVLNASNDEIEDELRRLDEAIAAQQAAVAAAAAEATRARTALADATTALQNAEADVAFLRERLREFAVGAFVRPKAYDLSLVLAAHTLSDAVIQQVYLDARAQRDVDVIELYDTAVKVAADRQVQLATAAVEAGQAVEVEAAELDVVEVQLAVQREVADDVGDRIGLALAEAQALEALDAELSAEIAAEQQALIDALPPPTTTPPTTTPPVTAPTPTVPATTLPPTTLPAIETVTDSVDEVETPSTVAPPTTDAPAPTIPPPTTTPPAPEGISRPPLVTVSGFTVHTSIGDQVGAMISAAQAAGIRLGGGAYRSPDRQIALRKSNCGTSSYAIWQMSPSQCRPPTARPGQSLHEQGKAIDFTYNGSLIRSRNNDGFRWLAANAATYGFKNLPSEPWHWSTTGG